jgi:phytoene synthase
MKNPVPAPEPALSGAFAHCERLVRDGDPDRYFATLFAPADKRGALFALYAFSLEVARVRESVSAALPGEIRLQWWRDFLEGEARGEAEANPVAHALRDTIDRFSLPRQALLDLIDARLFDLYDDLFPTTGDLEGYCGETSSALMRLGAIVLANGADPGGADLAGHAGVAYAVVGLVRAFPWHARRGQVYVPADMLARYGVTREDIATGRGGPGLTSALADMRALARRHLDRVEGLRGTVEARAAPAFLALALAPGYLARMERADYDPFRTVIDRPQWVKQWVLWREARRAWTARGLRAKQPPSSANS